MGIKKSRETLICATNNPSLLVEALSSIPENITSLTARIKALSVYALKGAQALTINGKPLDEAIITRFGLATPDGRLTDREFTIVVPKQGTFEGQNFDHIALQQVSAPQIALLKPDYDGVSNLTLSATGEETAIETPLDELTTPTHVRAHIRVKNEGVFDGELLPADLPIIGWLREVLKNRTVRLATRPQGYRREVVGDIGSDQGTQTVYSDGAQISVASMADLEWLNAHGHNLEMSAFRMNITLEGLPAHALALIREVAIAGNQELAHLLLTTLCVRCAATGVIQETGMRGSLNHLTFLAQHAPHRPEDPAARPAFGLNAISTSYGSIVALGDAVDILQ